MVNLLIECDRVSMCAFPQLSTYAV